MPSRAVTGRPPFGGDRQVRSGRQHADQPGQVKKPGYDPAELFWDPEDSFVKLKDAYQLARMKLGTRAGFNVVPLDPSCVGGSHGRLPDRPEDGPVVLCSEAEFEQPVFHGTEVRSLLLRVAGLRAS